MQRLPQHAVRGQAAVCRVCEDAVISAEGAAERGAQAGELVDEVLEAERVKWMGCLRDCCEVAESCFLFVLCHL